MSEYDDYISGKVDRDAARALARRRKHETKVEKVTRLLRANWDGLPDSCLDMIDALFAGAELRREIVEDFLTGNKHTEWHVIGKVAE